MWPSMRALAPHRSPGPQNRRAIIKGTLGEKTLTTSAAEIQNTDHAARNNAWTRFIRVHFKPCMRRDDNRWGARPAKVVIKRPARVTQDQGTTVTEETNARLEQL